MNFYKILIISLFFTSFVHADIRSEFPSYSYVLTEFDVDERFIDNQEFKNFVNQNKRAYRKRFINAVKRGNLIVPTIKKMLYQQDISPVFLYISMVESAFDPKAKSRTGAGGLWQFTVDTGSKEFNLHVGNNLDERYDPIRATNSAIQYLYKMNNNLGAWYLTAMAYNCGNGCVNRSIARAKSRDLATLISSRNGHIKPETRKYIKKILLMAMIGENYLFKQDDNLGQMMSSLNKDSITPVKVRSGESLTYLSNILNMDSYYLKKINAHLKNGKVPPRHGYKVNIPTSKVPMFYKHYTQNNRSNNIGYYKYAQR
ncbi:MAG: Membrane-bound lytic murein transglycosylase D precursor (EC [uncultured Sulfurovum sp.]|uniref:Membrane-bound lytic murein transglycosylase D (EC) n=1 Tax=uncultured Sulfurovum sp. TaxID=269237 RepID=A0A6S6SFZ9_9BACT|nr:MAG: Membrane-bound lytic murein transglycosylase D precursor (EC [uncultured Sulfurovum sp.]